MWDHNNTPPFEEPTSSLVTAMLVTVGTPLWTGLCVDDDYDIRRKGKEVVGEGVKALWTGIGPNVARNAIINAAELASYDQVKQTILKIPGFTDNVLTHLLSGLGAGFFAVCIGSPVDVMAEGITYLLNVPVSLLVFGQRRIEEGQIDLWSNQE
ncbi:mitochondrial uncoupling protein 1 [Tanacetum coccineum]